MQIVVPGRYSKANRGIRVDITAATTGYIIVRGRNERTYQDAMPSGGALPIPPYRDPGWSPQIMGNNPLDFSAVLRIIG
jgi:hypothetical protein